MGFFNGCNLVAVILIITTFSKLDFFPKITQGLTGLPCLKFGLGVGGLWAALFVIGLYCNHRPVWECQDTWEYNQCYMERVDVVFVLILFPDSELEWWTRILHGLDRTGSCSGQIFSLLTNPAKLTSWFFLTVKPRYARILLTVGRIWIQTLV